MKSGCPDVQDIRADELVLVSKGLDGLKERLEAWKGGLE